MTRPAGRGPDFDRLRAGAGMKPPTWMRVWPWIIGGMTIGVCGTIIWAVIKLVNHFTALGCGP